MRHAALGFALVLLTVPTARAQAPRGPGNAPEHGTSNATRIDANAALQAAYGTPPPDASVDPSTRAQPGFTERGTTTRADQQYGTTARGYDNTGNIVSGHQVTDQSLYPAEPGYGDQMPDYHVVQDGDTLWDVSSYYHRDPYSWPKLWSYNEHITNPHWIFPGDRIRLVDPDDLRYDDGDDEGDLRFRRTGGRESQGLGSYMLNQTAYVDASEFEEAMEIVGGAEAKVMMATLDMAYMDYDEKSPPIPGERLLAYSPQQEIKDIKGRKTVGYVVQVVGEIDVTRVARDVAEGKVVLAINPVERGFKVGPLKRRFKKIDPVAAEENKVGRIVATITSTGPVKGFTKAKQRQRIGDYVLAGEDTFVIVSLGEAQGVKVGNVLEVVRKGDEFQKKRVFKIPYNEGWPRRVTGTLMVVEVKKNTSLAVVLNSTREVERGDYIELNGPGQGENAPDQKPRGQGGIDADASASGSAGDGKAEAKGEIKIGK